MLSNKEQKFIKSLKIKKYRQRESRFLVEGTKNVLELMASSFETELLVCTKYFEAKISANENFRVEVVSESVLAALGNYKTNDSAIAVVRQKVKKPFDANLSDYLFVLDRIGDPGNLGTIIRTLDWFGFDRLLCSRDCAELYHPKTISSTMGSFTRVDVFYDDIDAILANFSGPVYAADLNGKSLYDLENLPFGAIIMGNESHGISPNLRKSISHNITIPKVGSAESLNVGIATGIIANHLRMF